jgi:hypothetical protein
LEKTLNPNTFFVLPTAKIYREMYSNKFVVPGLEKTLRLDEVLVDMYHPGPRGAYLLTNRCIDFLNNLHDKEGKFPLRVKPFDLGKVMSKPLTRPLLQSINPLAHEKTILSKQVDALVVVDESTIPADIGDQACE